MGYFKLTSHSSGEALPSFPTPTHSRYEEGGLKRWTCVNDWIANIDSTAPNHDVAAASRNLTEKQLRENQKPYSGLSQTATIVTSGTNAMHPYELRKLTHREMARLQTFPLAYKFPHELDSTTIKRQIGNAFPPVYTHALYEHIRKHLRVADRLNAAGQNSRDQALWQSPSQAVKIGSEALESPSTNKKRTQRECSQVDSEVEFMGLAARRKINHDDEELTFLGYKNKDSRAGVTPTLGDCQFMQKKGK